MGLSSAAQGSPQPAICCRRPAKLKLSSSWRKEVCLIPVYCCFKIMVGCLVGRGNGAGDGMFAHQI